MVDLGMHLFKFPIFLVMFCTPGSLSTVFLIFEVWNRYLTFPLMCLIISISIKYTPGGSNGFLIHKTSTKDNLIKWLGPLHHMELICINFHWLKRLQKARHTQMMQIFGFQLADGVLFVISIILWVHPKIYTNTSILNV